MKPFSVRLRPFAIANAYGLLLGAMFFCWPVVAGISSLSMRFVWIACALILVCACMLFLKKFLHDSHDVVLTLSLQAIVSFLVLGIGLLVYSASIPPLAFSDELTIAIPGTTAVFAIATKLTWAGVWMLSMVGLVAFVFLCNILTLRWLLAILSAMAVVAGAVALSGFQSGIAIRYPPLVHMMQMLGTMLTFGHADLFRAANLLWTLLLCITLWTMTPRWSTTSRSAVLAGLILSPLAWTYRVTLYQACGEMTLCLVAAFLLWTLLLPLTPAHSHGEGEQKELSSYLGIIFALWFLERPTSIAALGGAMLLLIALRRWKQAWITACAAFPAILAWLFLAPLYTSQYQLTSDHVRPTSLMPLWIALRSFPDNFSAPALSAFAAAAIIALIAGNRNQRFLLASAWALALPPAILQHMLAGASFYGVGRYNVLFLVPFALSIGILVQGARLPAVIGRTLAGSVLIALFVTTPFDFIGFTQHLRTESADIYRTPPEGYLPLPINDAAAAILEESVDTAVILTPHYTFLDDLVARRNISIAQRTAIIERSKAWFPGAPARPVLVQAPVVTSYQPNLSVEEENRLKQARDWARSQPHEVVRLGVEEAIIVR